jgi:uncharacterized protein (TIGR02217 family)
MAFHEVQFPTNISYGSQGGPGYSTEILTLDSGQEVRISRWSQARHQYDAGYGVQDYTDLKTVLDFFHARYGQAHGFRWKDWMDYASDSTGRGTVAWDDQNLGTFGTATATIQLRKAYTSGSTTVYRNITKPVSGTVKVGWDHDGDGTATEQSSGWSVDTTTGLVTITNSNANGKTIYAGYEFDVPARFGDLSNEVLNFSHDSFETGSVPSIPIIEIRDTAVSTDDFNYGGAKKHSATGSITIPDGRVHWTAQSSGNYDLTLPQPTNYYALGGPYFYILHTGSGGTTTVKKHDGTTLKTLSNDQGCAVHLVITGGTREFRVWG